MNHPSPEDDPFVDQLRRQPSAPLPDAWRGEILAAALAAAPPAPPPRQPLSETLRAWLWPRPLAYVGLLATWVVILALRLLTPASASPSTNEQSTAFLTAAATVPPGKLVPPVGLYARHDLTTQTLLFSRELPEEGRP